MKVTVTQEHINRSHEIACRLWGESYPGICTSCPIALALQDLLGDHRAWTNGSHWGLNICKPATGPLPDGARLWVGLYDQWYNAEYHTPDVFPRDSEDHTKYPMPFVPFTFDLEEYPPSD